MEIYPYIQIHVNYMVIHELKPKYIYALAYLHLVFNKEGLSGDCPPGHLPWTPAWESQEARPSHGIRASQR